MKLEFGKLEFENFLSYRQRQILPLNSQGLVSLEGDNRDESGSNRAGKSAAIPDALVWILFDRTVRGVRGTSVVNRHSKRNCSGRVTFRIGKIKYDVRRYQSHRKHKNRLRLFADGKEQSHRHKKQTQERLERLLGCNYDSFVNSVVFGGARPFAALSDGEQKKLLQSFLHFEKIDRALLYVRSELVGLKQEENKTEKKLLKCEGHLLAYRAELRSIQENEKLWRSQFQKRKKELEEQLSKLSKLHLQDCFSRLGEAERDLKKCSARRQELESEYVESKSNTARLEASKKPQEHYVGLRCPVCWQKISAQSARNSLQHLAEEIQKEKKKRDKIKPHLRESRLAEDKANHKFISLRSRQQAFERERDTKTDLRKELWEQIRKLEKNGPFPISEKKDILQSNLSRMLSRRLRLLQKRSTLQRQIEDYSFWEQGFGNRGLKALLVRRALPAMNAKLAEYAKEIFGDSVDLQFAATKETVHREEERELFHLEYRTRRGAASYLGESSGGRRRVDVCILLVFSWLTQLCNILLIDELLDGLDTPGKESVLRILSGLRGTVICISHATDVKSYFSKRWLVTKRNGESSIAIETQI